MFCFVFKCQQIWCKLKVMYENYFFKQICLNICLNSLFFFLFLKVNFLAFSKRYFRLYKVQKCRNDQTVNHYRKWLSSMLFLCLVQNAKVRSLGLTEKQCVYTDVPPQFMSFLTLVVDMILLLRKKSASCPPIGTTIVITMWGTADRIPTCT